ncbi:MAG: response regulator [Zetaproteobacteria bacterium]|nr:MAG: response regulator [Zetaproteobacteria bacterium]
MRILVVDDSAAVRGYHTDILNRAGHETAVAINGVEGLDKALLEDYDLFLVDVNMPKMDGYEFVRQIREDARLRDRPAIMISTESKGRDKIAAFDAGIAHNVSQANHAAEVMGVSMAAVRAAADTTNHSVETMNQATQNLRQSIDELDQVVKNYIGETESDDIELF